MITHFEYVYESIYVSIKHTNKSSMAGRDDDKWLERSWWWPESLIRTSTLRFGCLPSLLFSFNLRKKTAECDGENFYLHHHYSAFPRCHVLFFECVCQEFEFHVWFEASKCLRLDMHENVKIRASTRQCNEWMCLLEISVFAQPLMISFWMLHWAMSSSLATAPQPNGRYNTNSSRKFPKL